jgi:hypothetical protein
VQQLCLNIERVYEREVFRIKQDAARKLKED